MDTRRDFIGRTAAALLGGRSWMSRSWQFPDRFETFASLDELSSLSVATAWINTPALTSASLKGKVVLVQFWTFTCINWLRTMPYVRGWTSAYKNVGLTTIGVHTPEFIFEHDLDNIRSAVTQMQIGYPVAVDNTYGIWNGFSNQYWPALYLLDGHGRIRYRQFGEGDYDTTERAIREALKNNGVHIADTRAAIDAKGIEAPADWSNLRSPENYVGYERGEGFASPGGVVQDRPNTYTLPRELTLNRWALDGRWTIKGGSIVSNSANDRLQYCFHGRDLHFVMGPPKGGRPVRFRVSLDRQPPLGAHGLDVDEQGNGVAVQQRLHQLIRQPGPIRDRICRIEFLDPGIEGFSFTFG